MLYNQLKLSRWTNVFKSKLLNLDTLSKDSEILMIGIGNSSKY